MKKESIECVGCNTSLGTETLKDRLVLKDRIAIVPGLDAMIDEVIRMRLPSRTRVGDELVQRVKMRFEIPASEEKEYREALMDEYDRRTLDFI